MKNKVILSDMQARFSADELPTIDARFRVVGNFDIRDFHTANWSEFFPGNVLVKCQYCGQWAARMTQCKNCGGAVE